MMKYDQQDVLTERRQRNLRNKKIKEFLTGGFIILVIILAIAASCAVIYLAFDLITSVINYLDRH